MAPSIKSPAKIRQSFVSSNVPWSSQPLVLPSIIDSHRFLAPRPCRCLTPPTPLAPLTPQSLRLTPLPCRTLIDVETRPKGTNAVPAFALLAAMALAATSPALSPAQSAHGPATPSPASSQPASVPPTNPGFFPLSQIRPGMTGTAWTVFQGSTPEPMQVEILGVLRGARGPGQDLILARLHGDEPEYTGVVEGMSGSPVYIDGKLAGSLSYRIGQFTKEPIAGITPIEQMLEVRDLPVPDTRIDAQTAPPAPGSSLEASNSVSNQDPFSPGSMTFQPLDTPLVMSGFLPDAIRFWQQQTAGTSLEPVAAGGSSSPECPPLQKCHLRLPQVPAPIPLLIPRSSPVPQSACNSFAAISRSPPPAPSRGSTRSSFLPVAILFSERDRYRSP